MRIFYICELKEEKKKKLRGEVCLQKYQGANYIQRIYNQNIEGATRRALASKTYAEHMPSPYAKS